MHTSTKKHKNYIEHEVVASLKQKHDIYFPTQFRQIQILKGKDAKGDIGIKSRGKTDFLVNFCGYSRIFVSKFQN